MTKEEVAVETIKSVLLKNRGISSVELMRNEAIAFGVLNGYPIVKVLNELIERGDVSRVAVLGDGLLFPSPYSYDYLFWGNVTIRCGKQSITTRLRDIVR